MPERPRERWLLVFMATATMALSYIDRQTLSVLAPTVRAALDINDQQYGWLTSAFSMAYLVGTPLGGLFVDRVGARDGLVFAVLLWSCVAGLHAVVPGFAVLFALRIALGIFEAPSFPGAAQTVYRALPPSSRPRGIGLLFTGSSIGAMLTPPIASFLAVKFGWRAAFLFTSAAALLWIPAWLWASRDGLEGAAVSESAAKPSIALALQHKAVWRGMALVVASCPVAAFMLLWGPLYFAHDHGFTQADIGRYLWIPPVAYDVSAVFFGDLASRRRDRHASPRGLVAANALLCACVGLVPLTKGFPAAVALCSLALAGVGGMFAVLTSDMLSRVPASQVSVSTGLCAAAQSVAYAVVSPLIGRTVQHAGYAPVLTSLAFWVIPGVLVWLLGRAPQANSEEAGVAATATADGV